MVDESQLWLRHFVRLLQATVLFHLFQTVAALFLWFQTASPVLLVFCLDAFLGACRESLLGARLWRHPSEVGGTEGTALDSGVGVGYVSVGLIGAVLGVFHLWAGRRPDPTLAGVALAAASMLVIPIIGSYMKALAMELRSRALKAASVATFGNSYLSMVLLISLLVNAGMERWWSDATGALVMAPFVAQKGIQILAGAGEARFVED